MGVEMLDQIPLSLFSKIQENSRNTQNYSKHSQIVCILLQIFSRISRICLNSGKQTQRYLIKHFKALSLTAPI